MYDIAWSSSEFFVCRKVKLNLSDLFDEIAKIETPCHSKDPLASLLNVVSAAHMPKFCKCSRLRMSEISSEQNNRIAYMYIKFDTVFWLFS